jgi:hypothetical protein
MIRQGGNPSKKRRSKRGEGEEDLRDKILKVSVNKTEIDEIQQKADTAGLSRSRFVREVALGYKVKARDTTITPELIKLNAEIGRVGNNANQIARQANSGGMYPELATKARKVLEDIEKIMEVISDLILDR